MYGEMSPSELWEQMDSEFGKCLDQGLCPIWLSEFGADLDNGESHKSVDLDNGEP